MMLALLVRRNILIAEKPKIKKKKLNALFFILNINLMIIDQTSSRLRFDIVKGFLDRN